MDCFSSCSMHCQPILTFEGYQRGSCDGIMGEATIDNVCLLCLDETVTSKFLQHLA